MIFPIKIEANAPEADNPYNQFNTVSEALAGCRIVSVSKLNDGRFLVTEGCDSYWYATLTKEELLTWAAELRGLAES